MKDAIEIGSIPGFVLDMARSLGWLDPREAASLRQEVENERGTREALERRLDEVRGERDALRACDRKTWPDMLDKATARAEKAEAERDALAERLARESEETRIYSESCAIWRRRASRYRLRLARVLDLCMRAGLWVRRGRGPGVRVSRRFVGKGVWSRALAAPRGDGR